MSLADAIKEQNNPDPNVAQAARLIVEKAKWQAQPPTIWRIITTPDPTSPTGESQQVYGLPSKGPVPGGAITPKITVAKPVTGAAQAKSRQAVAVKQSGQDLIGWIDAHPGAFGISMASLSRAAQSRNPEVAEAATRLASFAALQPALHGSRGIGMQKEFEEAVGKAWSTPEVLKARIRALMDQADKFMVAAGEAKPEAAPTGAITDDEVKEFMRESGITDKKKARKILEDENK
jgi:hypothetical protein